MTKATYAATQYRAERARDERAAEDVKQAAIHEIASRVRVDTVANGGAWYHEGQIWLDLVEVYPHESYAVDVARSRGELAIYDLSTGTEIAV